MWSGIRALYMGGELRPISVPDLDRIRGVCAKNRGVLWFCCQVLPPFSGVGDSQNSRFHEGTGENASENGNYLAQQRLRTDVSGSVGVPRLHGQKRPLTHLQKHHDGSIHFGVSATAAPPALASDDIGLFGEIVRRR
jgi:hypothetical protein